MKDGDVLRVIGATVLAGAIAILTQSEPYDAFQAAAFSSYQTETVPAVDREQFKSQWDPFRKDVRKQWRALNDEDLQQIDGDYDRFVVMIHERYGDRQDVVRQWADEWYFRNGPGHPAKTEMATLP